MKDKNKSDLFIEDSEEIEKSPGNKKPLFTCESCGLIDQDNVIFKCNTCSGEEALYENGIYMCPDCLLPGENFECMSCGGTKVTLDFIDREKPEENL